MPSLPDILIRDSACVDPATDESAADWVLAPWLAALPRQGRDLLALLPVLDVNALGLAALPNQPGETTKNAIAAVFCADPFLRVRDAVQLLRAAGIGKVTNFPTIQIIDGSAAHGFESAGLGTRREAEILGEFAQAGFEIT
uniref:phosphoenolpyruvate hydrolase family protein n=1 Tax=Roseinatronobacter sp. TaxID=1945755 RepID=UPI0025D5369C